MAVNHIVINTGSLYADKLRQIVNQLRIAQKALTTAKANMEQMIDSTVTPADYATIAEKYLGQVVPGSSEDGVTVYNLLAGAELQLRTQADIVQFLDRFGGQQ